jgi:cell division protein FtsL
MAPSSTTAVRRVASSRVGSDPGRSESTRPPLKVVSSRRRAGVGRRFVRYLPAAMVVVALLVVVAGQALLANGQVRMAGLDQQLQAAQAEHSQREESVSKLETPSRIVKDATASEHMVRPGQVTQLPYVSLHTPLATPNVTTAPAGTTTTTTPAVAQ